MKSKNFMFLIFGCLFSGMLVAQGILIQPGSFVTIQNAAYIKTSGTAGLTLSSTESGTGSLIDYNTTNGITVSGTSAVERYITNDFRWHFLSSPVSNQDIWPQFAPDPGADMAWGAAPYNWDFYYWNPTAEISRELYWVNLRKNASGAYNERTVDADNSDAGYGAATQLSPPEFTVGRGYLVAYNTNWTTGSPTTHTFTGTLTNGDKSIPIIYHTDNSYNLVGNPYPSAIDWSAGGWTRTDLETSTGGGYDCWIWNDNLTTGNYGVCNSITGSGTNGVSKYIPTGQAFFVKAKSTITTGAIGMTNGIQKHVSNLSQPWLKTENNENNLLRLKISCDANTYSDEMIVEFNPGFDEGGSDKFGSFYTEAPEIYSVKGGKNYSITRYKELNEQLIVDIATKTGITTAYKIQAVNINDFTLSGSIIIKDLKTGILTNLKQSGSYSFSGNPADDKNRFQLILGASTGLETESTEQVNIYAIEKTVFLSNLDVNEHYDVIVSNIPGQKLIQTKLNGVSSSTIICNYTPGIYIVTLISQGQITSCKVMLK